MRKIMTDNKTNLLNASVRIVHQEENFLTYSPEPAFSLVLYINQTTDDEGNRRMKKATEELQSRFQAISAELYKQAASQKPGPQPGDAPGSSGGTGSTSKPDENVVDADFEVVDDDKKKS